MNSTVRDRIGAATGAAFVILIFVGNTMSTAGASQSAHPTGQQVLADTAAQADSASATVGFVLEVLGFVAFIGFVGFLADLFRRTRPARSDGIVGASALVAATVMLAIKLGSAGPLMVLVMDREALSPQLARVLNDMNGAAFIVSWLPLAVFVGCAAVALKEGGVVGRPTAYVGLALGAVGVPLTIVGVHDPVAANPLAFLLGLLWVTAVSVRLTARPAVARPERGDRPTQPADERAMPVGA